MTAWSDGTALWLRGTNEVVDGKEGLPPSISPLNTSCERRRGRLTLSVVCNKPYRTSLYSKTFSQNIEKILSVEESESLLLFSIGHVKAGLIWLRELMDLFIFIQYTNETRKNYTF